MLTLKRRNNVICRQTNLTLRHCSRSHRSVDGPMHLMSVNASSCIVILEKLTSIEVWPTTLLRYHAHTRWTWPWPVTSTFNPTWAMVVTNKTQIQRSVGSKHKMETNRKDGRTLPIALLSRLMWSLTILQLLHVTYCHSRCTHSLHTEFVNISDIECLSVGLDC